MAEGVGPAVLPAPTVGRRGAEVFKVMVEVGMAGGVLPRAEVVLGDRRTAAGLPALLALAASGFAALRVIDLAFLGANGLALADLVAGPTLTEDTTPALGATFLPRFRRAHLRQIDCVGGGALLERLGFLARGARRLGDLGVLAVLGALRGALRFGARFLVEVLFGDLGQRRLRDGTHLFVLVRVGHFWNVTSGGWDRDEGKYVRRCIFWIESVEIGDWRCTFVLVATHFFVAGHRRFLLGTQRLPARFGVLACGRAEWTQEC